MFKGVSGVAKNKFFYVGRKGEAQSCNAISIPTQNLLLFSLVNFHHKSLQFTFFSLCVGREWKLFLISIKTKKIDLSFSFLVSGSQMTHNCFQKRERKALKCSQKRTQLRAREKIDEKLTKLEYIRKFSFLEFQLRRSWSGKFFFYLAVKFFSSQAISTP